MKFNVQRRESGRDRDRERERDRDSRRDSKAMFRRCAQRGSKSNPNQVGCSTRDRLNGGGDCIVTNEKRTRSKVHCKIMWVCCTSSRVVCHMQKSAWWWVGKRFISGTRTVACWAPASAKVHTWLPLTTQRTPRPGNCRAGQATYARQPCIAVGAGEVMVGAVESLRNQALTVLGRSQPTSRH
eukprot:1158853-Pelagomonas_calceolata.AAC.3